MTDKTISQHLEHMTYFADITIKQIPSEGKVIFECIADFIDGGVVSTGYTLESAIEALNEQMRFYVNNC